MRHDNQNLPTPKEGGLTIHRDDHTYLNNAFRDIENELSAEGLFTLAVWHQSCEQIDLALDCYRKATVSSPTLAEAFYNMGILYYELRRLVEAIQSFEKAVDLRPDNAGFTFNLAAAYKENQQYQNAIDAYSAVIRLNPDSQVAYYYKAICYQRLNDHPKAIHSFKNALRLDPQNAMAWFNMAESIRKTQSIDNVLQCYGNAVKFNPDWDKAHYNLAVALRIKGNLSQAIDHMQIAIDLNPDFSDAHAHLFRLAQHACDWDLMAQTEKRMEAITASQLLLDQKTSELPMISIRRVADPKFNVKIASNWSRHTERQSAELENGPIFHHHCTAVRSDKIRIGYLSGDFKDHAVAHQIRGLLAHHNRDRFEIIGYASNPDDGTAYRRYLQTACDTFKEIHDISDTSAARLIHEDGIQILVDLSTHSRDNRMGIAALRPAPIQISYLGFLGSTGAGFIDYTIADRVVIPPGDEQHYSEEVVYLPYCYQANDDHLPIADTSYARADFGLPDSGMVYCSFNQPYKIEPQLFDIWMKILQAVEGSVLWLIHRSDLTSNNLRHAATAAHIDPSRLIFSGFLPLDDNLARLRLADLVLDTRLYNGGATTSNALWAGVPVLAMLGSHWVSRMSASALYAMDLPELVVKNAHGYQRLAVELGRNPRKLQGLRQKVAHNRTRSPLFDTRLFTRHLEQAYSTMHHRQQMGMPAKSFTVEN